MRSIRHLKHLSEAWARIAVSFQVPRGKGSRVSTLTHTKTHNVNDPPRGTRSTSMSSMRSCSGAGRQDRNWLDSFGEIAIENVMQISTGAHFPGPYKVSAQDTAGKDGEVSVLTRHSTTADKMKSHNYLICTVDVGHNFCLAIAIPRKMATVSSGCRRCRCLLVLSASVADTC